MKLDHRASVLVFSILALIPSFTFAQPARDPQRTQRVAHLQKLIEQHLASYEAEAAKPGWKTDARLSALYARYVLTLEVEGSVDKASAALKKTLALQDMDEKSAKFGEFAAGEGTPDTSGIGTEVILLPLCEIVMTSGEKLPAELRQQLVDRIKAGLAAYRRKPAPPVDASSVYLFGCISELLAGEITRDDKALAEAESRLTNFIGVARVRGVAEYTSPNFTGIQLGVLLSGYVHTTQPSSKRLLESAIKFLWAQTAANVVPVRGVLGGPHGRDYDFLFGGGSIDWYLFLEGLRPQPPGLGAPLNDGIRAYVNEIERGYRPDETILALGAAPAPGSDRIVRQRWGIPAGADRYFYVTPDYAIGSSSQVASTHDRKLTVEFATRKPLPVIAYIADPFDSPYGKLKRDGRPMVPSHLREQMVAVQEKGTMLALMNLRADLRNQQQFPGSLGSNVLIPLGVDSITIDGRAAPINGKAPFDAPATLDTTVIVREGAAAVAIKLFAADGAFGDKPAVSFKYDGNPFGVARLVAYHYRLTPGDRPRRTDDPIRVGVAYIAARCETPQEFDAFQQRVTAIKIEQSTEGNAWRAKLVDDQLTLDAGLDLKTGSILARKINGEEYQSTTMRVNDRDLANEYLADK